jgi:hypothetical protein
MNLKRTTSEAPPSHVIDAVIERYVAWREESVAVNAAYGFWSRAAQRDRAQAFGVYLAALDREELAAAEYRSVVEQVGRSASLADGEVPPIHAG